MAGTPGPSVAAGELRAGPPGPVRVRGRIVTAEPGRALLEDDTGALWVDRALPIGCVVEVEGLWTGTSIRAERATVAATPLRPFPAPDGDFLHFHAQDRARLRRLRARHHAMRAVRAFFDGLEFLEVETPLAVPSPGLDLHLSALGVSGSGDAKRWLVTSPEYQMKRLLSAGLPRIYQLGRAFRADERGDRHELEFTMLEWYRAFSGSEEIMRDTEALVAATAQALLGTTVIERGGKRIDLAPPWERLPVADLFRNELGIAIDTILPDETRFFRLLVDLEPALGAERPVFLTEWPASMASLARTLPDRPDVADRFEAFVAGMELCNGFGELVDAREQRSRLERDQRARAATGLPVYPLDERFLGALEDGLAPSGGNALGVDRLLMLLTGAASIGEVLAFPEARL